MALPADPDSMLPVTTSISINWFRMPACLSPADALVVPPSEGRPRYSAVQRPLRRRLLAGSGSMAAGAEALPTGVPGGKASFVLSGMMLFSGQVL